MEKEDLAQLKISRSPDEPVAYRRSPGKKIIWALVILLLLSGIGLGYRQGYLRPCPGSLGHYGFPGLPLPAEYPP